MITNEPIKAMQTARKQLLIGVRAAIEEWRKEYPIEECDYLVGQVCSEIKDECYPAKDATP